MIHIVNSYRIPWVFFVIFVHRRFLCLRPSQFQFFVSSSEPISVTNPRVKLHVANNVADEVLVFD